MLKPFVLDRVRLAFGEFRATSRQFSYIWLRISPGRISRNVEAVFDEHSLVSVRGIGGRGLFELETESKGSLAVY